MEAIWVEKGEYRGTWIQKYPGYPVEWNSSHKIQFLIRVAWTVFPNQSHLQPLPDAKEATPDQWKFLTGLVVCGLATKVNV